MLVFYLTALDTEAQKRKFESVYTTYYPMMLKTAVSILKDQTLAEDAVHETFLQILGEIDTLRIENPPQLKAYLYLLTRERTIDLLRRWKRRKEILPLPEEPWTEDNAPEPEELVLTRLQLEQAIGVLTDMPEIYRRALTLRVKGYSVKEIAGLLHCSEANVKVRIHRARALLLKTFAE